MAKANTQRIGFKELIMPRIRGLMGLAGFRRMADVRMADGILGLVVESFEEGALFYGVCVKSTCYEMILSIS